MANKSFIGRSIDDFLRENDILEDVTKSAIKKAIAMKPKKIVKPKTKLVKGWVVVSNRGTIYEDSFSIRQSFTRQFFKIEYMEGSGLERMFDFEKEYRVARATLIVEA